VLSKEARERIAAAQRKRWAAQKKAAKQIISSDPQRKCPGFVPGHLRVKVMEGETSV
jgi:hypothetical protein